MTSESTPESNHLAVGIDAPLSYGAGGGSRATDTELRRRLIELGGHPGTVMAPTAPRMVYLTLRGVAVARTLGLLDRSDRNRIVEVHPGAALLLRGEFSKQATFSLVSVTRLRKHVCHAKELDGR